MGGSNHGDVEEGEGLEERPPPVEYFGWVYHLGVNPIGHEYCHLRFLHLKGKHVNMYKRDPHENPTTKPTRRGTVGHTLKLEELGRKKVNNGDLYVMRFYDRLDESKKGEIACATAGETRKWMEAFDQAKQQAEYELSIGSSRHKLSEINLERHARVRRYANGLKRLIKIGKGPEVLLRQSSDRSDGYFERDETDAVEAHEWKCIRTVDGIRIFEDVISSKGDKGCLVKSVGVVDASIDAVFEVICSLDRRKRYEWDTLNSDLELVESVDGHYDVIYGTYDPKYLKGWHTKRDFVFSRQWFRGQDGSYTILHFPASHKSRPSKSGYQRTKIISSIWEIRRLDPLPTSSADKCLVMQMFEINSSGWVKWKNHSNAKFEKTIHYGLLNQVAGLKAYIAANPNLKTDSSIAVVRHSVSSESVDFDNNDANEEFFDAIAVDGFLEDEDSDESDEEDDDPSKGGKVKLKNVSWAIARLAVKKSSALVADTELDAQSHPVDSDASEFHGSMRQGKDETDANCWTVPSGQGFMIRGKTYLKDLSKVAGGDPLLKLLAVDWLTADKNVDQIALSPKCLVQSEAGKKLPFILVVNLQVPAKPNYSLVLYFGADRPVNEGSLLSKFIDGNDMFRDARFKLIPSIVEGYWMVKRAVGSKACLLGKAVTCKYLRQDNFLEIDVDIGSSSVARSIIGLVLGYVTSLVVDLAILIEAKEEEELPEYLLGTVRLGRVRLESAVPF